MMSLSEELVIACPRVARGLSRSEPANASEPVVEFTYQTALLYRVAWPARESASFRQFHSYADFLSNALECDSLACVGAC